MVADINGKQYLEMLEIVLISQIYHYGMLIMIKWPHFQIIGHCRLEDGRIQASNNLMEILHCVELV